MICLLSRGNNLSKRHGPLMISGPFFAVSQDTVEDVAGEVVPGVAFSSGATSFGDGFLDAGGSGSESLAGKPVRSLVDFERFGLSPLRMSVPGVGGDAKSLYELSVILGIFHGNLRKDMQQKMMANDQMSVG